jgi:hypothetical protein
MTIAAKQNDNCSSSIWIFQPEAMQGEDAEAS